MEPTPFYLRNMLLQYDKQLINARRLVRYERSLRDNDVPVIPQDIKRKILVERVARELYDNLIFTGSTNPIIDEICADLGKRFGAQFSFHFPPGELDIQIARKTPQGSQEIDEEEKRIVLEALWHITLHKVNETML